MRNCAAGLLCFITFIAAGTCLAEEKNDILYQYSTINALLNGLYDGDKSFDELEKHGDIGLGTFNGLNGEMVALDGIFYQVKTDGVAYPVSPGTRTPFAVVTFFDTDIQSRLTPGLNYTDLKNSIITQLTNQNHFYAFRIDGTFSRVTTRSVPGQNPPYMPLARVVEHQTVFHFKNIEGTLIGFYTPDYVTGLNVPGFHFHFLTRDRKSGGHVLDLTTGEGTVRIDEIRELTMELPDSSVFAATDLSGTHKQQLEKVEQEH